MKIAARYEECGKKGLLGAPAGARRAAAARAARAEGDPETKAQQLRNSTLLHAVASHDAPQVRTAADAGRSNSLHVLTS